MSENRIRTHARRLSLCGGSPTVVSIPLGFRYIKDYIPYVRRSSSLIPAAVRAE